MLEGSGITIPGDGGRSCRWREKASGSACFETPPGRSIYTVTRRHKTWACLRRHTSHSDMATDLKEVRKPPNSGVDTAREHSTYNLGPRESRSPEM